MREILPEPKIPKRNAKTTMNKNSIPGWTTHIDEISNGVLKVILTDAYGRKVEIIGNPTDETIERAKCNAFDIEKQISQNWNQFLYDLAVQKLACKEIKNKQYNDKEFGSWFIEKQDERLVYDGKDSCLIFQIKAQDNWMDIEIIKKEDIKYSNFVRQINRRHIPELSATGFQM